MSKIEIKEYLEKINLFIEERSLDQAAYHCLYLLRQFPKMVSIYHFLGRIFLETENYKGAFDVYSRLASSNPDNFLNFVTLSFITEKLNLHRQALFFEKIGIYLQPDNTENLNELQRHKDKFTTPADFEIESHFAAGKQLLNEKNFEKAAIEFQIVSSEKSFILNDLFLGITYTELGTIEKALPILRNVLSRSPCLISALRLTAFCLYGKDTIEFARYLEKLISIDPGYANYSIYENQIIPGSTDLNISYQDWTGFPNTKLRSGWLLSGDKYIDNKTNHLPNWLSLLPVCDELLFFPESSSVDNSAETSLFFKKKINTKMDFNGEDTFFQMDFFKSQVFEETKLQVSKKAKNTIQPSADKAEDEHSGLDEAFDWLEKVINEGVTANITKNENSETQQSETIPVFAIDTLPHEDSDAGKIREAWNCFSVGDQKKGIQLYRELIQNKIRLELVREDIRKLIILFPENRELSQLIS